MDLTRGGDRPTARLSDLVQGRSGAVYRNWLAEHGEQFRSSAPSRLWTRSKGCENAIDDQPCDAASVPGSFHVIELVDDALDEMRRRNRQDSLGHRPAPSPRLPAWAGLCENGKTRLGPPRHRQDRNGPTEAINGVIELGRRTVRGYRNHNNHRLRNLLEVGGPARHLHRKIRKTDNRLRHQTCGNACTISQTFERALVMLV